MTCGWSDVHVCADPGQDNVGSAIAIMIGLFRSSITMLLHRWRFLSERSAGRIPELIDILSLRRELDLHDVLAFRVLHLLRPAEVFGRPVISLGTPTIA